MPIKGSPKRIPKEDKGMEKTTPVKLVFKETDISDICFALKYILPMKFTESSFDGFLVAGNGDRICGGRAYEGKVNPTGWILAIAEAASLVPQLVQEIKMLKEKIENGE